MNRFDEFREQVLDESYSFLKSALLQAAVKLRVFEAIGDGTKTASTIAAQLCVNVQALERLLDALVSLNWIYKIGSGFRLSEVGKTIFLARSERYLGDLIGHQEFLARNFFALAECVQSGKPLGAVCNDGERAESAKRFLDAKNAVALGCAEKIAKKIDLMCAKTLIEIGSGTGVFSVYFLKQNPELRAVFYERPAVLDVVREFVSRHALLSRVDFRACDFKRDAFEGTYDVAFLSGVISECGEEENEALFKKISVILGENGRLIVLDFLLNDDKVSPQFAALFSLHALLHTEKGRAYAFGEVRQWMERAGFLGFQRVQIRLPYSMSVIIGKK